MIKTNILTLFKKLKFDYASHEKEVIRIGDSTAIRELRGQPYRRNYERALLLMALASHFRCSRFLEFGTGRGFVTAAIASLKIPVHTIDHKPTDIAKQLITDLGISVSNITFIGKPSDKIKASKLPIFDLVFIDGGHDYPSVRNDFILAKKVCKKGFIVFDDFRKKHGEVKKFIKRIRRPKLLVNTDGWVYDNAMINKARDADGVSEGKETKSGQVIIPINHDIEILT